MSGSHIRVTGYCVPWWMALAGALIKATFYAFVYLFLPTAFLFWPGVVLWTYHYRVLAIVAQVAWLGLLAAGSVWLDKARQAARERESAVLKGAEGQPSSDHAGEPHQAGR